MRHCKEELLPDSCGLPRGSNQKYPCLDGAQDQHSKTNSHTVVSIPVIREQKAPLCVVREVRHIKQQLVFVYPTNVNTEACDTFLRSLFEKANLWLLLKGIT